MSQRILLVDDERSIRESLSKVLEAEGYAVVLAENGQQAMEQHGPERIDLLILDLNTPVQSGGPGWEWMIEVNPLLPVIIITGRTGQRAAAETAGVEALMEKPLDVPLLLRKVRELLAEPIESRASRARLRTSGFRALPSNHERFDEMLLKCCLRPAPRPELGDSE